MSKNIRVTVWGENVHEKKHEAVAKIYPKGMHDAIASGLKESKGLEVKVATLGKNGFQRLLGPVEGIMRRNDPSKANFAGDSVDPLSQAA